MAIYICSKCGEGTSTSEIHICKENKTPFFKGYKPNFYFKIQQSIEKAKDKFLK